MSSGWVQRTLAELAVYQNGRAFKPTDWTEIGLPIVRIAQITDPNAEPNHYDGEDVDDRHIIDNGDLLFSWSATLAVLKWNNGPAILNQHIFKVVENDGVCRDFLRHLLHHSLPALAERSHGSTMKHIRKGVLREHLVSIPPLPEQRKIAAILSSVDDAIEKTQAVIDQVEVVKRGLMQELLTRGLPGRHTRFKQTEIGEIPEEWGTIRLGDVATVKGGKRMPKGRPFAPSVTPYPYIRVCDFKDGSVDTSSLEYVLPEDREQICRYTISKEDIYISIAGTLGIVGTVPPELDGAQLTENAARIIINDKRYMNRDFVKIAMKAECCQAQFGKLKGIGGGVPKLALFRIEQVRLPLPNQQEQQEIVDVLESIGAYHSTLRARLDAGHRLKLALMSVLLTGELRVTPDAEVA